MSNIEIYTDGSCSGNPGPGGWASVIFIDGDSVVSCGMDEDTTNNRMELKAFIAGLEMAVSARLEFPFRKITIYTDSKYIENPINCNWIDNWVKNDFKGIKNRDLWEQIIMLLRTSNVETVWVKGHGDSVNNNAVDDIAKRARDGIYGKRATMVV